MDIEQLSGIEREEGETIEEYFQRVGDSVGIDSDVVDDSILYFHRKQFDSNDPPEYLRNSFKDFRSSLHQYEPNSGTTSSKKTGEETNTSSQETNTQRKTSDAEYDSIPSGNRESVRVTNTITNAIPTNAFRDSFPSSLWSASYAGYSIVRRKEWGRILRYLPVIGLIPVLTAKIPTVGGAARGIASNFQALSFIRYGLASFSQAPQYVTWQETDAALHLYSILSSPLIALGYTEGMRLVSLIASIAAAAALAKIAESMWGRTAGLVAVPCLFLNPYFVRYAWGVRPEALSVAFTTLTIVMLYEHVSSEERKWFLAALIFIALGVANHAWEAIILAPALVLLLLHRKYKHILITVLFGGLTVWLVRNTVDLTPLEVTTGYSITSTGVGLILSWEWWTNWWIDPWYFKLHTLLNNPFMWASRVQFFSAIFGSVILGLYGANQLKKKADAQTPLILSAWLASGLVIPFLLPGGVNHKYYLWGTIAPVTLLFIYLVVWLFKTATSNWQTKDREYAKQVLLASLVLTGFFFAVGHEAQIGGPEPAVNTYQPLDGEAVDAGNELRRMDLSSHRDVVLVGNWSNVNPKYVTARIFVYAHLPIEGSYRYSRILPGENSLLRYSNSTDVTDCGAMVIREPDGKLQVQECN